MCKLMILGGCPHYQRGRWMYMSRAFSRRISSRGFTKFLRPMWLIYLSAALVLNPNPLFLRDGMDGLSPSWDLGRSDLLQISIEKPSGTHSKFEDLHCNVFCAFWWWFGHHVRYGRPSCLRVTWSCDTVVHWALRPETSLSKRQDLENILP